MPQVAGAVAVVVTMIGTTTFDGFSQGSVWTGTDGLLQRLTDAFDGFGLGREAAIQGAGTVGLLAVVLIVAGLYRLGIAGHALRRRRGLSSDELARRFAHTLIPIAFAYLVAHYFSLLLFQGQAIVFLVSDPLGQGSDLFGTAVVDDRLRADRRERHLVRPGGGARHRARRRPRRWPTTARSRSGATARTATRSQYWMLLVMVTFTCLGSGSCRRHRNDAAARPRGPLVPRVALPRARSC